MRKARGVRVKGVTYSVTFAIPENLRDRLDSIVKSTHTNTSCVIRAAIEKYLTEQGY